MKSSPSSPLSALSSRVIEATWLMAVLVVPVLYDPHALRSFDSLKIAALRTLGLTAAIFLLLRLLCDGLPGARLMFRGSRAWLPAVLGVLAATFLATVLSINPAQSFWGSPDFQEGAFTLSCLAALFVAAATHFRTAEQARRLVSAALLGSLPVCLYALMQRMDLDPKFPTALSPAAVSFAGHPLYLSGYLLMVMPLCAWALWKAMDGRKRAAAFYAALLCLQVFVLVSTEKRGSLVSVLAMAVAALLLLAACHGRFHLAVRGLALAAVAGIFLTALALAGKAGLPLSDLPLMGRLSLVVPVGQHTGDDFRDSLWSKAPEIVMPGRPFVFPGGTNDIAPAARSAIGYGPETLASILPHFWLWLPAGPAQMPESRFHNQFWQTWQSIGWLGLLATFWLGAAIFAAGVRALGLPFEISAGRLFVAASAIGAATAAVLALVYGRGYIGLGIQAGFAMGLPLAVLGLAWLRRDHGNAAAPGGDRLLTIAMLAAFAGHQVDMAFIFTSASTSMLFWIFSGALIGWGLRVRSEEAAADAAVSQSWVSAGIWGGALTGVLLIALVHAFLDYPSPVAHTAVQILQAALGRIQFEFGPSHLLPLVFLPTWIAGACLLPPSLFAAGNLRAAQRSCMLAMAVSLLLAAAFGLLKANWIAALGPIPAATAAASAVLAQASGYGITTLGVLGLIAAAVVATAAVANLSACRRLPARGWCSIGAALLLVAVLCWEMAWRAPRREAFSGWAGVLDANGRKALAAAVYRKAIEIEPASIPDRIFAMKTLMECASLKVGTPAFSVGMAEAEAVALPLRKISELNFGNYYLGRFYNTWAMKEADPDTRMRLGSRARDAFSRAIQFSPGLATAWFEASVTDRLLLGDKRSADFKAASASQLLSDVPAMPWGSFYAIQARGMSDSGARELYARHADALLDQALQQGRENERTGRLSAGGRSIWRDNAYRVLILKGEIQQTLGDLSKSAECFAAAARQGSSLGAWRAETLLAHALADLGRNSDALQHVDLALASAPGSHRPELEKLKLNLATAHDQL